MKSARKRVGILISGRGSNMLALIEAARSEDYPAEIVLVVSDRADARGLALAEAAGIPTAVVERAAYSGREPFEDAIERQLVQSDVEIVCLAGFMRILSESFVERWRGRMLNIHPSLLPDFKGLNTHARALAAGVKVHGCSVHFVVPELDSGPVVLQASVPVREGDDEHSLAARVLAEEHRIYPLAVRLVAEGRVTLESARASEGAEGSR